MHLLTLIYQVKKLTLPYQELDDVCYDAKIQLNIQIHFYFFDFNFSYAIVFFLFFPRYICSKILGNCQILFSFVNCMSEICTKKYLSLFQVSDDKIFLNYAFQSYYDLFQVNRLVQN